MGGTYTSINRDYYVPESKAAMSEKINEMTELSYKNWMRAQAMKGFKPGKVGNAREIEDRCEETAADQDHYGEWMILEQKKEEQRQYELRCERRARKVARESSK